MGFLVTLIYVSLAFLSPADLLPTLAPYRVMVWLAAVAAFLSLVPALQRPAAWAGRQGALLVGFIGAIAFSRVAQGWFGGVPLALQDFLPSAVCFFFVAMNTDTLRKFRVVAISVVCTALLQTVLGIQAYYQEADPHPRIFTQRILTESSEGATYILRRLRALGSLNDPNDFAQYLVTSLPLLGVLWKPGAVLFFRPALIAGSAALLLYGVYLTGSRGGLLGLAVLMFVPLIRRRGRLVASVVTAGAVLLMLAMEFGGGREITIAGGMDRLNLWSEGLGLFKSSPLWGVGYRSFADHVGHTAHNSLLLCAAELGILGLFFWTGLVVFAVLQLRAILALARTDPALAEHARLAALLELALFAFLVTSWFLSRAYVPNLYLFLGMIAALHWRAAQDSTSRTTVPDALHVPLTKWLGITLATTFGSIALLYAAVRSRGL